MSKRFYKICNNLKEISCFCKRMNKPWNILCIIWSLIYNIKKDNSILYCFWGGHGFCMLLFVGWFYHFSIKTCQAMWIYFDMRRKLPHLVHCLYIFKASYYWIIKKIVTQYKTNNLVCKCTLIYVLCCMFICSGCIFMKNDFCLP